VGGVAIFHKWFEFQSVSSNALAYLIATALNYFLNYHWAFNTSRTHKEASWRFLSVVIAGALINSTYVTILTKATNFSLEYAAFSFSLLWPIFSFGALKFWALR
jgi:putative flippase GtrA